MVNTIKYSDVYIRHIAINSRISTALYMVLNYFSYLVDVPRQERDGSNTHWEFASHISIKNEVWLGIMWLPSSEYRGLQWRLFLN